MVELNYIPDAVRKRKQKRETEEKRRKRRRKRYPFKVVRQPQHEDYGI
jgi:hypothetical protein